jgi:hypothetical protein
LVDGYKGFLPIGVHVCSKGWSEGPSATQDPNLGRITRDKNATARAFASGSSGGSFQAWPLGVCWTIRGTLIVAAWAGFSGRLRGRVVTMVMVGSYVWPEQSRQPGLRDEALMGDLPTAKNYSGVHTVYALCRG